MNYYIFDLHIGHANAIRLDGRPFANLNEMHRTIINNWNSRVKTDDTVYILGDFIWYKEKDWPFYVEPLAGNKVLIRGNHDPRQFSAATKQLFQDITNLKEIEADKRSDDKERRIQKAMISLQSRYGKNAVLKGMNLQEGATTIERNGQVGGHKAQ